VEVVDKVWAMEVSEGVVLLEWGAWGVIVVASVVG